MAKTTRKTESTTEEKKPVTSRKKAADQPTGAVKPATRRRTKAATGPVAAEQPVEQAAGSEPTHDEIALRAWEIYQRRGASHGQAMNDWLQAKAELFRERGLIQ
jgi:hypothetical protein